MSPVDISRYGHQLSLLFLISPVLVKTPVIDHGYAVLSVLFLFRLVYYQRIEACAHWSEHFPDGIIGVVVVSV
jgi:hypothetical protein